MEGEAVVRQQLINVLGNRPHESVFTIDLCRALRQPKKVVNRVLYRLQREGLVHKVVESPPAWKLNGDWKRPISLSPHSSSSKFVNGVSPSSEKNNKQEPCTEEEGQERQEGTQLGVQMTIMDATSPSAATAQNGVNPTALQNGTGIVSPAEAADTPAGKGPPAPPKSDTVCIEEQINAITEKIISYLKSVNSPVFTTDLAKAVGLRSKKEINPILYRLQEQGLVKKENDIPPLWRAVESATTKVPHMSSPLSASDSVVRTLNEIPAEDLEKKILSVLSNSGKAFMNALEIAKAIGLSSKREVNPALYRLLKQGRVRKVSDLPPMWAPGVAGAGRGDNKASAPQDVAKLDASFQKLQTKDDKVASDDAATKGANGDAQQTPRSKDSKTSAQQGASSSTSSGINSGSSSSASDAGDKASNASGTSAGVSSPTAKNDTSTNEEEKNAVVAANNQGSSHPPGKQGMTGVKRVLNSSSFAALMKNPVSAFHEYGQMHHIEAKIDIVGSDGPLHNPRFKAAAVLGNEVVGTAWAKSKKEAKRQAAELAIRSLVAQNDLVMNDSTPSEADVLAELGTNCPIFDTIAALSHVAFNKAVLCVPEYVGGRKVLAALVMKKTADDVGTVICFGTGNRCISGERMSQEGTVVNDSHAEVITRRSFLRYLYQQLLEYQPEVEHPLFEPCDDGTNLLRIKENVTFHLYISTAPCGDAALFSHHCKGGPNEDTHEKGDNSHTPLYANSLQGLLRTKMEAGEGTIPVEEEFQYQTWDAIMRGERLRTMSCSDKIARWNVVGLQGALLSHFMKPIYLDSVTLGNLYHHGHLSRAVCCRLENDPSLDSLLPSDYRLNHPRLGHVSVYKPPRETEKTKPYSINWCLGDERPELTNGVTGLCDERVESQRHSRVSKVVLFESFKKVCKQFGRNDLLGKAYGETKHIAQYHQRAKDVLFKRFQDRGWGTWIRKPPEEEMFH